MSIDRALLMHICTAMSSLVREGSYRSSMAVAHQITRELQNRCYHHHQKSPVWSEMRVHSKIGRDGTKPFWGLDWGVH